jgi:glycosyltransferase involved in cell wall biosynthesis
MMPLRIHLLGLPNSQTTAGYELDGFAVMTLRFAEVLKRLGAHVILYGGEENTAPCSEFVTCITKAEQARMLGETPYQRAAYESNSELFTTFNARAQLMVGAKKQPGDIICTIAGSAQWPILNQHPELMGLEYSIGYRGVCAPYRVYQSHLWRHVVHGFSGMEQGREFDGVIPGFFDVNEFPEGEPDDYVAYCGRLDSVKGLSIACQAAQAAGVRLVVMGHGDPSLVTYGDYVGAVSSEERNRLLAGARAVLMPTRYLEPFGNVSAEAQLCGTPVIGPDFGAFVETVAQGMSGFRCTYLGEYVKAIQQAGTLDRGRIRAHAQWEWGLDTAVTRYRNYFNRLALLKGDGWNALEPYGSESLDAGAAGPSDDVTAESALGTTGGECTVAVQAEATA